MKKANRVPDMSIRLCSLTLALAMCFPVAAPANPVNPTVMAGQAGFNTAGNTLTVTNTPNAIINWQGFSIGPNETTRFIQQSAASAVLNRVTGGDPSQILGALQSNGRVFLINPNGIAFGAGSRIDVGGLVASTLNLSDADFLSGRMNFTERNGAGAIVNEGEVRAARGGQILLIAPQVENAGLISAPNGEVLLAAGKSVRLVDIANPEIQYEVNAPENAAINLGSLMGRSIGLHGGAIRHSGLASADNVGVDEAGRIVFRAVGEARVEDGTVSAASTAGHGGRIEVLGNKVVLTGAARLDASGATGGGTVLVGGDYQGGNRDIPNAERTFFGAGAVIRADATQSGDGGKVIVWADEATRANGTVSARGGERGGDGGFVEVSGKKYLDFRASVDTRAPVGKGGTLLLDPDNLTIVGGGGGANDTDVADGQILSGDGSGTWQVSETALEGLSTPNVILQANESITIDTLSDGILALSGGVSNFTLQTTASSSSGGISFTTSSDEIRSTSGAAISLIAGGSGSLGNIGKITSSGATGGTISLTAAGGIDLKGAITSIGTTYGTVVLDAGASGITGNASGMITAGGLKVISGGAVALGSAAHAIDTLAGSSGGSFQFADANGFTVGTVAATIGLTAGSGDISLTAGGANSLLTVGNNVQALDGSVTYVADNQNHAAATTSPVVAGKFIEIKPYTAGTQIEFDAAADAAGFLRLSPGELGQFTTPLLKVGNSAVTGNITVNTAISPANFSALSLITSGSILQTSGSTITIAGLNADGHAGVNLTEANDVDKLGGHTNAGAFSFTDADGFDIALVDVNNGISSSGGGNIVLTSSGGGITQSGGATLATSGAATITAQTGITLNSANTAPIVSLNNSGSGHIAYSANTASLSASAANSAMGGNLTLSNTGSVVTTGSGIGSNGTTTVNATGGGSDITVTTWANITGNDVTLNAGRDVLVNGSEVWATNIGGNVNITAGRDIRVAAAAGYDAAINSVGDIFLTATTGKLYLTSSGGNSARVESAIPNTVHLNVPGILSGGYVIDGVEGSSPPVSGVNANTGIFTNGTPAVVGATFLVTTATPPAPTLADCIANPALSGCDSVLPSLATCTAAPTTPGCEVVLPSLATCTAAPTTPGCSAVLPSLATCTVAPTTPGCSAVLPSLATCTVAPTTPGCSAVLPSLATCTVAPTTPGCSAVLPSLATCTAAPTTPGCSAVLPSLATCTVAPATPGCSAVLPPGTTEIVIAQLSRDLDSGTGPLQNDDQEREWRRKKGEELDKGDGALPQEIRSLKDLPECRP